ncbi:DUF4214 domain-containing protein [Hydrogenophilus hirschii]
MTVQQFITTVYQNVLGRDEVDANGMAYWTQKLTSGEVSRGQFVRQIIKEAKEYIAAAPASDPYKWVGTYLDNRKAVGEWFANNSTGLTGQAAIDQGTAIIANSVTKATAQAGQTTAQAVSAAQALQSAQQGKPFMLTTGVDNITGTAGNDTILAVAATTGATLSAADQINGGAGTDTLKVTIDALAANSFPAVSTTGVEIIDIRNVSGNAQTITGTNFVGATEFISNISTAQVDFESIGSAKVKIQGNNVTTNGAVNITAAGLVGNGTKDANAVTTAFSLTLDGGVKAASANIYVDDANAAWTEATVYSTGAANTVQALNLAGKQAAAATHTLKTLTIEAATNLKVGTLDGTVDITGFDMGGSVTNTIIVKGAASKVELNDIAGAVDVINASDLTAGGVVADISGTTNEAKFKFTGGKGNDTLITNAGLNDAAAFLDGGDGTDTLALKTAETVAAQAARIKNFEELRLDAGITQDVSLFTNSTIGKIIFNAAGSAVTNLNATQAANIVVQATPTNLNVGVKNADQVGQIDTVKVTVDDGLAAVNNIALGTPVLTGIENLELTANDNLTITALTSATALSNLTLKGAGTQSITWGNWQPQVNTVIDGSAATGALTIDLSAVVGATTTNAVKIIGGSKGDTITASGGAADIINGKGGLDTIDVTKDTSNSGYARVESEVTASADADKIVGFVTGENKFIAKNALVNGSGTSSDGIAAAEVVTAATFAAGLADPNANNKVVFIATTNLSGTDGTALTTLTSTFSSTNIDAFINALVGTGGALNGTIANLDSVLGASDAVLLALDNGTHSALLRITNTDTTVANTLTAAEVQLVGVFQGTAALAAGDFA